jgi:putative membrane protein
MTKAAAPAEQMSAEDWSGETPHEVGSVEFLGTQGDPWDTQSDMLFALIGAIAALALFSRTHDRQIRNLTRS